MREPSCKPLHFTLYCVYHWHCIHGTMKQQPSTNVRSLFSSLVQLIATSCSPL